MANQRTHKIDITEAEMLEAITNTQGLISKIKRNLEKIKRQHYAWETVEKYAHKWPSCEDAIREEKETMLDVAENNVFIALNSKDLATSKWYLKMKGQERGYIETQEVKMGNSDPLNINLNSQSAEDLKSSPMVEVGDGSEENGSAE